MEILKFFKKVKKEIRQRWIPWKETRSPLPVFDASGIPVIRRGLQLYSSLLISTPMKATGPKGEKEIPRYLRNPCSYMSRANWLKKLTEDFYLYGQFICWKNMIDGKLKDLPPFLPNSIYCYARKKDNADPIELSQTDSFYYISEYGERRERRFLPEDIYHLKRMDGQNVDQLNGLRITQLAQEAVDLNFHVLKAAEKFAKTNFISPQSVKGISEANPEQKEAVRMAIEDFLEDHRTFLTLPEGVDFQSLVQSNVGNLLMAVASIAATAAAQLFNCPSELIERSDMATTASGHGALKESHRHWLRHSGRSFLEEIGESFSTLCDMKIEFKWKAHQASDMRESSTFLPALQQAGIITEQQAREWIS